tara:strand:- start:9082 stop:10365 length:1284 start_codon:yes stop_codon:yes gene_type:complete
VLKSKKKIYKNKLRNKLEKKKISSKDNTNNKMVNQAVILCGGLGTRLGAITKKIPKPLIKIGNKSFLDILIDRLVQKKINKILLLCSYKSNHFFKKYHNKKINGKIKISCIDEKKPLGTGGALVNALNKLDDYFYLLNGDTYFDGDLLQLQEDFDRKKFDIILSTKKLLNDRYGELKIKSNRVLSFQKNKKKVFSNINLGTYIIKKKILNKYKKQKFSLESVILPELASKQRLQCSFFQKNFFLDIGVRKDLKKAKLLLPKIKYPTVFFDRDGVINRDLGYVSNVNNFHFTKGIFEIIKYFNRNSYHVFIVTNQSGIGRGYYTERKMLKLHDWMQNEFKKNNIRIDEIFHSPYYKYSKNYSSRFYFNLRKPNIGMFKLATKRWNIDKKNLLMIGDKKVDFEFGRKIKAKTIIVKENLNIYKQVKSLL